MAYTRFTKLFGVPSAGRGVFEMEKKIADNHKQGASATPTHNFCKFEREVLEAAFSANTRPLKREIILLARELQADVPKVQGWFRKKRWKQKKIERAQTAMANPSNVDKSNIRKPEKMDKPKKYKTPLILGWGHIKHGNLFC
ncbi:hypothetical protein ACOME3_009798 [Neoechinorhynchus agilis]